MIAALIKWVFGVACVLLGVILGISNTTPIALSMFTFTSPELPFFVWLLLALLFGFLLATVVSGWRLFRVKRQYSKIHSTQSS
jgi:uncharacterized integral membrane protein